MFLAYFLYQFVQNVGRVHNASINTGIFLFALSIVSITQWLGPDTSVFSLYLYNFSSAFRRVTLSICHLPFFVDSYWIRFCPLLLCHMLFLLMLLLLLLIVWNCLLFIEVDSKLHQETPRDSKLKFVLYIGCHIFGFEQSIIIIESVFKKNLRKFWAWFKISKFEIR